jgi:hypothetical protein
MGWKFGERLGMGNLGLVQERFYKEVLRLPRRIATGIAESELRKEGGDGIC